jgi:hypothetical protein
VIQIDHRPTQQQQQCADRGGARARSLTAKRCHFEFAPALTRGGDGVFAFDLLRTASSQVAPILAGPTDQPKFIRAIAVPNWT